MLGGDLPGRDVLRQHLVRGDVRARDLGHLPGGLRRGRSSAIGVLRHDPHVVGRAHLQRRVVGEPPDPGVGADRLEHLRRGARREARCRRDVHLVGDGVGVRDPRPGDDERADRAPHARRGRGGGRRAVRDVAPGGERLPEVREVHVGGGPELALRDVGARRGVPLLDGCLVERPDLDVVPLALVGLRHLVAVPGVGDVRGLHQRAWRCSPVYPHAVPDHRVRVVPRRRVPARHVQPRPGVRPGEVGHGRGDRVGPEPGRVSPSPAAPVEVHRTDPHAVLALASDVVPHAGRRGVGVLVASEHGRAADVRRGRPAGGTDFELHVVPRRTIDGVAIRRGPLRDLVPGRLRDPR
ncbi:hypothetical protein HRbin12_01743 [bacterium HR12]|nr:hypothetical protein HRbin12_01743 [bacterium HR12]